MNRFTLALALVAAAGLTSAPAVTRPTGPPVCCVTASDLTPNPGVWEGH
ncbi:hypothetical protein ACIBG8_03280 [Nonomuraea sp. NPDC050556]